MGSRPDAVSAEAVFKADGEYRERDGNMTEQEKEETKAVESTEEETETAEEVIEEAGAEEEVSGEDASGEDPSEDSGEDVSEGNSGEDVSGEASEEEAPMSRAEKKAARKQAKHDKKAEAYKEQIGQLEDKVKRQLAEFENFRNRSEKEKQAMFETGAKSVIEKILPVVDNFERGLATVPEEKKEDPFVDGMTRVYKQLLTELENIGVKPIEAVGKEFDPNLHNAVMQAESEEYESGVIAQELQKGYTYRDSVVRHSMVSVTK